MNEDKKNNLTAPVFPDVWNVQHSNEKSVLDLEDHLDKRKEPI